MGKMLAFLAILGTLKLFRHYYLHLIEEVLSFDLMEYSGGSRISPRTGCQLSGAGANIRFSQIFPKTA